MQKSNDLINKKYYGEFRRRRFRKMKFKFRSWASIQLHSEECTIAAAVSILLFD